MLRDLIRDPTPEGVYQVFGHRDVGRAVAALTAQFVNPVRLDGVDVSDWQEWPTWDQIPGDFFCARLCDGNYADEMFVQAWRWAQGRKKWPGFYVLPDPRLGWAGQLAKAKDLYARAGVSWGAPGHWWSIDDEPTSLHGQFTGQGFVDLCHAFEDWLQRPQLCYSGYYSPNRPTITSNGIPWWIPWPPDVNGDVPAWAYQLIVAHQWGVAGAGEVPGFPSTSVDVDQVMRADEIIRISVSGEASGDDVMSYLSQDQQYNLYNRIEAMYTQFQTLVDKVGWLFSVFNDDNRWGQLWNAAGSIAAMEPNLRRVLATTERADKEAFVADTGRAGGRNVSMDAAADRTASATERTAAAAGRAAVGTVAAEVHKIAVGGGGGGVVDVEALAAAVTKSVLHQIAAAFGTLGTAVPVAETAIVDPDLGPVGGRAGIGADENS